MKLKNISLFTIVVLAFFFLASPDVYGAQKKKQKENLTTITGRVVTTGGSPVAGAVITAMEGTKVTRTASDGKFSVASGVADYICVEADNFESRNIYLPNFMADGNVIVLDSTLFKSGAEDMIAMPFGDLEDRRITGAVTRIRLSDHEEKITDNSYKTYLKALGFGMFGASDIRGLGYVVMVDGLVRDGNSAVSSYVDMMNIEQIEDITILKDAASRMLYGANADKGIIMIRTKRGQAHKREINVRYESDFGIPISYPEYLSTSNYMILYNEALKNDGLEPKYTYDDIENARNGADVLKYPHQDYYNSEFLRSFKPQHKVAADFSGGNHIAQYYLNLGYYNTSSILKLGQTGEQGTNRFNLRGNVNVNVNKWISVTLDAAAIFNAYSGPNYLDKNFWGLSTSERVNAYPFLIPIDRVREEDRSIVDEAFAQRSVIYGKYLVGGDKTFTQNIYGDALLGGYSNSMDRIAQVNIGLNLDLGFITEGLKFRSYFASDNYNQYTNTQANTYAVYTPTFQEDGTVAIEQVGVNSFVGSQKITGVTFYRRTGFINSLNYDRTFGGKHSLNVVANSVINSYKQSGLAYSLRSANFGVRANYAYDNQFVMEYSGAYIGTARFAPQNRWGYAQAAGLGWILSENSLIKDAEWLDYLKLKATYARTKTDIDDDLNQYYFWTNTYTGGGNYGYGDGAGTNGIMLPVMGNPDLGWIKRDDINVGLEAVLLDNSLTFEANYYYTKRFDTPVRRQSTLPSHLGGSDFVPYENYGSNRNTGAEVRLGWNESFGDFEVGLTGTVQYYNPKVLVCDEINFGKGLEYRQHSGKPSDAIWGLMAEGLYTQEEIDAINDASNIDVVRPTFGEVQAGDVKYRDLSGDKKIDNKDLTVIGNTHARFNYGLVVDLKWKNWGLWMYCFAQTGGSRLFQNNYYHVYGEMKYPLHLVNRWAYDPENGIDTRNTATYPRLTTLQNKNNYSASSYWIGSTDYFAIPDIQVSYSFGERALSAMHLKGLMLYLKAGNLLQVGPNADKLRLNIGSEPQYRTYCVGLKLKF